MSGIVPFIRIGDRPGTLTQRELGAIPVGGLRGIWFGFRGRCQAFIREWVTRLLEADSQHVRCNLHVSMTRFVPHGLSLPPRLSVSPSDRLSLGDRVVAREANPIPSPCFAPCQFEYATGIL